MADPATIAPKTRAETVKLASGRLQTVLMELGDKTALVNFNEEDMAPYLAQGYAAQSPAIMIERAKAAADKAAADAKTTADAKAKQDAQNALDRADLASMLAEWRAARAAKAK